MSEIIDRLQQSTIGSLKRMIQEVLTENDQITALMQNRDDILTIFVDDMNHGFDRLEALQDEEEEHVDFETVSLVQNEELTTLVAFESMVASARNLNLPSFISFNTRLNALFANTQIDETTNPLDPQQIASAFSNAVRDQEISEDHTRQLNRSLNQLVLRKLDTVLLEANQLLVKHGVLPGLGMEGGAGASGHAKYTTQLERSERGGQGDAGFSQEYNPLANNTVPGDMPQNNLVPNDMLQNNMIPGSIAPGNMVPNIIAPGNMVPNITTPGNMVPNITAPGNTVPGNVPVNNAGQPQVFSTIQNLLHYEPMPVELPDLAPGQPAPEQPGIVPADQPGMVPAQQFAVPASMVPLSNQSPGIMQPYQPAPGEEVQVVDQGQLMNILTNIQSGMEQKSTQEANIPTNLDELETLDISESLGELMQEDQEEGVISALDQQSSDVINLVTLLYDAIFQDYAVPIPIKELIGRTQITIMKVALSDTAFFDREDHPVRTLLNDIATAGIGWTEVDDLAEDLLYKKVEEIVRRTQQYDGENSLFEDLIKDFKTFRARETAKTHRLEKRILKSTQSQDRLDDIHELVTQKIQERILDVKLDEFIVDFLKTYFYKFMVMLVLKEGPNSNAWKQSLNTIDVLLWTVEPHDQKDDRDRLEVVNPRLTNNLRKALRIAQIEPEQVDSLMNRLGEIQEESFRPDEIEELLVDFYADRDASDSKSDSTNVTDASPTEPAEVPDDELAEDDPAFAEIDALTVGTWVEFIHEGDKTTRCKLAAKINAIDKFIFVNRQGAKVTEKTRLELATQVKKDTVKIINEGPMFSRALESVISDLRNSQQQQQTGGAYQPAESD
ncbi:MAG: DUF1631 family protein [bacterium]|nr:DUF1631 family protein [Gammaproteobacteria bacterium]HIL97179.1 DUF1631 family protein [Pseudomonadales bacterium]